MRSAVKILGIQIKRRQLYHGLSSVGPNTMARLLPGMALSSTCSETRFRCFMSRSAVTRLAVGSCITTSRSFFVRLSYSSRRSSFSEASLHVVELHMKEKLSYKHKKTKRSQKVFNLTMKTYAN